MEELLKTLGFTPITGPLWKHEEIGIISISETDSTSTLANKIFRRGYQECGIDIQNILGIKSN